jgi:hypothetical protein
MTGRSVNASKAKKDGSTLSPAVVPSGNATDGLIPDKLQEREAREKKEPNFK